MNKEKIIELLRDRANVGRMEVRDKQLMLEAAEALYEAGYRKQSVGEWKSEDTMLGKCCTCSVCGGCPTMEYRYCPYCGAKMKGGTE